MNLKNVTVLKSRFGRGLFAARPINEGERVFSFTGRVIPLASVCAMGEGECYPLQIANGYYLDLDAPWKFMNHSCEPNCGIVHDFDMVALKPVLPGEELFFDYSTTMFERNWKMQCHCGSKACRGEVDDFDRLPKALQKRYLGLNIVQSFIIRKLWGMTLFELQE